jgi:hypothetical protein
MMIRRCFAWLLLILLVPSIGALSSTVKAQEPKDPEDKVTPSTLKKEVDALKKEVGKLRRDLEEDKINNNLMANKILERLDRIDESLRSKGVVRSISRRFTTGTIKVDNRLPVDVRLTIDSRTYRIPAGSLRTLTEQPTGTFSYLVRPMGMAAIPEKTTILNPGETLTLRID